MKGWHPGVSHIFGTKHRDYRFHAEGQEELLADDNDYEAAWVGADRVTHGF